MTDPAALSRLEAEFEAFGLGEDALDDLVHACKSREASAINNEGPSGQLAFLLDQLGAEELTSALRQLATVGAGDAGSEDGEDDAGA